MKIEWVHFPLHPETPAEGARSKTCSAGRGYDIAKMQAQMRARMAAEGLPYGERKKTFNSRLAQELAQWAEAQPGGDAIHDALFKRLLRRRPQCRRRWRIARDRERSRTRRGQGARGTGEAQFKAAIDADWKKSRDYGVTGVPTFVHDGKGVVGAQPYEALEQLVQQAK